MKNLTQTLCLFVALTVHIFRDIQNYMKTKWKSAHLQQFEGKKPKYIGFFLIHVAWNNNAVTSCWQTWYKLVKHGLVTRLLEQTCHNLMTTTTCNKVVPTSLIWLVVNKLVTSCCYKSANQQLVASLLTTSLLQLDKITSLLQIVNKLATSLFRQQLVNKFRPVKCHAFGMSITHFFHMDFVEIFRATLRRSVTRCGNFITTIW